MSSLTHAIGGIFQPILKLIAEIMAFFYSLIPSYPVAVALLTIVVMAALTPLTVKSTKNMAAMQALGPEMKKLQQKYKGPENRVQLNEEMMKLYKEHNVNPASGCLPMLLQMPFFFMLYSVIRGITNTVGKGSPLPYSFTSSGAVDINGHSTCQVSACAAPRYISQHHEDVPGHRHCPRPAAVRGYELRREAALAPRLAVGVHPLRRSWSRRRRPAVPADVATQCSESAGGTGQSAGGHAAEIHATHLRVHLPKCGRNSERLFHRFERNPDRHARGPVSQGHGARAQLRRPRAPRQAADPSAAKEKEEGIETTEHPLPKAKGTGGGAKSGASKGTGGSGSNGSSPSTNGSKASSDNGSGSESAEKKQHPRSKAKKERKAR